MGIVVLIGKDFIREALSRGRCVKMNIKVGWSIKTINFVSDDSKLGQMALVETSFKKVSQEDFGNFY